MLGRYGIGAAAREGDRAAGVVDCIDPDYLIVHDCGLADSDVLQPAGVGQRDHARAGRQRQLGGE